MPRRFCVSLAVALVWMVAAGRGAAPAVALPRIEGELSGRLTPLKVSGAPTLDWKLALTAPGAEKRGFEFRASGPEANLRVALEIDAENSGTWRVLEGSVSLARWYPVLVASAGLDHTDVTVTGHLTVEGEGTLQKGVIGGRMTVGWRDGTIKDPAHKLDLAGVTAELVFTDLAARRTAPAQALTWRSGSYDTFALGPGRVVFALDGDRVQVDEATLGIWGGEVVLAAFNFVLGKPDLTVLARLIAIDVTHVTPLLPSVLAEARGRVDGSLTLRRDAAGVAISAGRLALRPGETADLRLAPKPGLISGSLPPAILKYYPGLGKIETGEVPLRADSLEIAFTPGGDAQGRSATIHLTGGPVDPKLRAPVDLTINVRGPLESLIKFGTNSRLRFGGTP